MPDSKVKVITIYQMLCLLPSCLVHISSNPDLTWKMFNVFDEMTIRVEVPNPGSKDQYQSWLHRSHVLKLCALHML